MNMGLDVSVHLVIGVPLLCLGSIQEEGQSKQLVNGFGEPKGRPVTLNTVYLVTKNGRSFVIGSNEHSLADGRRNRVGFHFGELFDSDEEIENWIWQSDYGGGPGQVIIGRALKPIETKGIGRHETHKIIRIDEVKAIQAEVKLKLMDLFGYSGEVYLIPQVSYSY